ncbi:MAG: prenyltransferase [Elusimicrobia bacterium]|nr:prenyltransferase [Elusimicrobiota bacterium]
MSPAFAVGLWRLADPKVTLASMASLFLGTCAAASDGPLAWGWLGATVGGIFLLEVAKNASGEVVDFDSGDDLAVAPEDRTPFSGGKRVLVDGLLSRRETILVSAAAYAGGAAIGLWIALAREPGVLGLGLAGVLLAYGYHGAPLRLSYRGLGEAAVAVSYGPLIGGGAYLVQRGELPWRVLLLLAPLGLLVASFLWINEFPDYHADRLAGKRTLVVRLGRPAAARAFAGLVAAALLAGLALSCAGFAPSASFGSVFAAGPAFLAAQQLLAHPLDTRQVIPAQTLTLAAFVAFALGAGLGLL